MKNDRNTKLNPNAQILRKEMTGEEKHLWYDFLKKLPCTVRRQKVLFNYIVDFYIDKNQIVIELDGRQHLTPEHKKDDAERDEKLSELGYTVLRYSNESIHNNFNAVCSDILKHLGINANELKK